MVKNYIFLLQEILRKLKSGTAGGWISSDLLTHHISFSSQRNKFNFFAGIQVLSGAKSWVGRNVLRRRAGAGESQKQKKVDGNPKQEQG